MSIDPGIIPRTSAAVGRLALLGVVAMCSAPVTVYGQDHEADVTAVVDAYHAALVAADSTTALELLHEEVTILESGGVEDKDQYRSGHLAGDMRFAGAVPRERSEITVTVIGEVAWAWSTNVAQGRMGDRDVNSRGAELMVLRRETGTWKIVAIHWSSRAAR